MNDTEFSGSEIIKTVYDDDAGVELLSITAVHPMREDAVKALLVRAKQDWQTVRKLIKNGRLVEIEYKGYRFYLRRFSEKIPIRR